MKKPSKTAAELEAAIKVEMEDICEQPTDIALSVQPDGDTWKVVVTRDIPKDDKDRFEMISLIADRLRSQFDLKAWHTFRPIGTIRLPPLDRASMAPARHHTPQKNTLGEMRDQVCTASWSIVQITTARIGSLSAATNGRIMFGYQIWSRALPARLAAGVTYGRIAVASVSSRRNLITIFMMQLLQINVLRKWKLVASVCATLGSTRQIAPSVAQAAVQCSRPQRSRSSDAKDHPSIGSRNKELILEFKLKFRRDFRAVPRSALLAALSAPVWSCSTSEISKISFYDSHPTVGVFLASLLFAFSWAAQ
jgi:hypothetical protein